MNETVGQAYRFLSGYGNHRHLGKPEQQKPALADWSREAAFLGLPVREVIQTKFDLLLGELAIQPLYRDQSPLRFAPEERVIYPLERYERSIAEIREDQNEFALRLQRLKARISAQLLSGTSKLWKAKDEAETSYSDSWYAKIQSMVYDYSYRDLAVVDEEAEEIIKQFNAHVPAEFQWKIVSGLNTKDLDLLSENIRAMYARKPLTNAQKARFEEALQEVRALEEGLSVRQTQGELFATTKAQNWSETKAREVWERYRFLLKLVSTLEEAESWYSPTYGENDGKGLRGPSQESAPFTTDYQRFRMKEAERIEHELNRYYVGLRNVKQVEDHSLLFQGGQNALHGVFGLLRRYVADPEVVAKRGNERLHVLRVGDIYAEVEEALDKDAKESGALLESSVSTKTEDVVRAITQGDFDVAYLSPVSNTFDFSCTDVAAILEALCADETWKKRYQKESQSQFIRHKFFLVVDNTLLGRLAKWKDFDFAKLPDFLEVISFESLIKFGQDGQELTQAGLITVIAKNKDTLTQLEQIRAKTGSMPTEQSIRRLSLIAPDIIDKRLERHSRNAKLIAELLEEDTKHVTDGFLVDVSCPSRAAKKSDIAFETISHGEGAIVCFGINTKKFQEYQEATYYKKSDEATFGPRLDRFEFPEKMSSVAKAYIKLMGFLLEQVGVELHEGTSYGLNTTRCAVYRRSLPKDEESEYAYSIVPYIRIAVGTEHVCDADLIARAISRANHIFTQALREHRVFALADALLARRRELVDHLPES